jgi:hypothetical protein
MDAVYEILEAVVAALNSFEIAYILMGGSLLGAVRQHSILFTDDDVDIAIIERTASCYPRVREHLPCRLRLRGEYVGSDRVRLKRVSNVFLDLFCIPVRKYESVHDLRAVLRVKKFKVILLV